MVPGKISHSLFLWAGRLTRSWCALILLGVTTLVAAPTPTAPASLGSARFQPSPEQPIGWRGDWTGRFPGATPPVVWSRRVKGITSELRYQAAKPAGEPGAESQPLEYFTIKDWLVAGPFDLDDPVKDFDRDFLDGEAKVEPEIGRAHV